MSESVLLLCRKSASREPDDVKRKKQRKMEKEAEKEV
jgi:hypothetical protein